jgi:hypothetical protein
VAKIIPFPSADSGNAEEFIKYFISEMKEHGIQNLVVAGKTADDTGVYIGYYKCDFPEKFELCSHIQCDITERMVRANME